MRFDEHKMQEVYDSMPDKDKLLIKHLILNELLSFSLCAGNVGNAHVLQSISGYNIGKINRR